MKELDFIDVLAERLGSRKAAEAAVRAFTSVVLAEVACAGRVVIPGFGAFDAAAPKGSNGGVGRLRFRPGTRFLSAVQNSVVDPATTLAAPLSSAADTSTSVKDGGGNGTCRLPAHVEGAAVRGVSGVLTFRHYAVPTGVSLSAVLPESSPRCGIYVLHFDDGSRYVGQALDVLTRFGAHRRRWPRQLTGLDFAPAAASQLNDLERQTIQQLERCGTSLYNSALVGLPMGDNPLDLRVDRVAQERWLDGGVGIDYDLTARISTAALRSTASSKLNLLRGRADYGKLRFALLIYLVTAVPWPHETEHRFWSVTSMPSTNRSRTERRLVTLSVNNVETLVLAEGLDGDKWLPGGFLNVSPGLVERSTKRTWPAGRRSYRTVGDVEALFFAGFEGLIALLQRPDAVTAARTLALGLMRKGRGMMAKYHDEGLADDIFRLAGELEEG